MFSNGYRYVSILIKKVSYLATSQRLKVKGTDVSKYKYYLGTWLKDLRETAINVKMFNLSSEVTSSLSRRTLIIGVNYYIKLQARVFRLHRKTVEGTQIYSLPKRDIATA